MHNCQPGQEPGRSDQAKPWSKLSYRRYVFYITAPSNISMRLRRRQAETGGVSGIPSGCIQAVAAPGGYRRRLLNSRLLSNDLRVVRPRGDWPLSRSGRVSPWRRCLADVEFLEPGCLRAALRQYPNEL